MTTGIELLPEPDDDGAEDDPLVDVVTGEEAEYEDIGAEPVEEAPVVALLPPPPPLEPAAQPPPAQPPAPAGGRFGLACLVTWIVRRITFVWTSGLSATFGAAWWRLELSATPPRPARPIAVAAVVILALVFVTSKPPRLSLRCESGEGSLNSAPRRGKETAKPLGRPSERGDFTVTVAT